MEDEDFEFEIAIALSLSMSETPIRSSESVDRFQLTQNQTAQGNQWRHLQASCRATKSSFIDPSFGPSEQQNGSLYVWKRAIRSSIGRPSLWADGGPHPEDILQGKLADCWFLSALSVVAENPKMIEEMFVHCDVDIGAYEVSSLLASLLSLSNAFCFVDSALGQWTGNHCTDR
jgi:hypothetical protein